MAAARNARRLIAMAGALILPASLPAQYIGDPPPPLPTAPLGPEQSADALARNVRILAQNPRDYPALVGAGRAALATGDAESAVGFFGRAAEIAPSAAAPRAGTGAALAAMGEPNEALAEFVKAQRLGASPSSFAADRGLARDLLGQQALAQADYRLALAGPNAIEARRRLALSLAISGNRQGALAALAPLLQRSDVATNRVRAFVLALGGDAQAANRALDRSVPGLSRQLDPFFRRLPTLTASQKAAAVHLGIIPGSGSTQVAQAPRLEPLIGPQTQPSPASGESIFSQPVTGNRLAGIDALLRDPPSGVLTPVTVAPPIAASPASPPQDALAAARATLPSATSPTAPVAAQPVPAPKRIWVQLASGSSEPALGGEFTRIAARDPESFKGLRPFVSVVGERTKLLVGPFKTSEDSETFVQNLSDSRINAFSWTSPEGQPVRRLANP